MTVIFCASFWTSTYAASESIIFKSDEDSGIAIASEYQNRVLSQLEISGKTATCISIVRQISSVTKITVLQKLQRKQSSGSWVQAASNKKTVSASSTIYTNTVSSLSSGTYRVASYVAIYEGTAVTTVVDYSNSVTI